MINKESFLVWADKKNDELIGHAAQFAKISGMAMHILQIEDDYKSFTIYFNNGKKTSFNKKSPSKIINDIKEEFQILFIITAVEFTGKKLSKFSLKTLKKLKKTELTFICLKDNYNISTYKTALTIGGFLKGERDKIMWMNFLGRKFNTYINIIIPNEKSEGIVESFNNLVYFSNKLLSNSKVNFNIFKSNDKIEVLQKKSDFSILDDDSIIVTNFHILNMNPFAMDRDIKFIESSYKQNVMVACEADDSNIPCH